MIPSPTTTPTNPNANGPQTWPSSPRNTSSDSSGNTAGVRRWSLRGRSGPRGLSWCSGGLLCVSFWDLGVWTLVLGFVDGWLTDGCHFSYAHLCCVFHAVGWWGESVWWGEHTYLLLQKSVLYEFPFERVTDMCFSIPAAWSCLHRHQGRLFSPSASRLSEEIWSRVNIIPYQEYKWEGINWAESSCNILGEWFT